MARSLITCSPSRTTRNTTSTFIATTISRVPLPHFFSPPQSTHLHRLICKCSNPTYQHTFSHKMSMAGLKPHHRVALGVSGGSDSIALCVLAAAWKSDGSTCGLIDGILAIIVDHGLRVESQEEANCVRNQVLKMGIRCEIARCEWPDGRPKLGHLQEAAREMRYQIFQKVCIQHQIGALLIAHHADDQAELFVLRLSRNSGVLGLAGMAFTSQLFSKDLQLIGESSNNHSILVVRPLLEFSKEDMYKICEGGNQEWVEDPTNRSPLYARNRIRMALRSLSARTFNSELQAVISACRQTRSYVDRICRNLIDKTLTIMAQGYAVIDLEILGPSNIDDICLSKFIAVVLQFVSQRYRPIRGSTSKLLLDYVRTVPCKTSLTAAGCYLCAAPGSKGTKLLVCYSVMSLPSNTELFQKLPFEETKPYFSTEVEQIIKSYSDHLGSVASPVHFLGQTSSEAVLSEARRLNILSDSTHTSLLSLQSDETKHFKPKTERTLYTVSKHGVESVSTTLRGSLQRGEICYFMNRFLVTWKQNESNERCSWCCVAGDDVVAEVRHMADADWLYLGSLCKCPDLETFQSGTEKQLTEKSKVCFDYVKLSAQRALVLLKSIPVAARRGMPVLVDHQGLLLSIPSIGFNHCPCMMVSAVFKPKVPLGGGHTSFT